MILPYSHYTLNPLLQESELASSLLLKRSTHGYLESVSKIQRLNHMSDPQLEENRKE